jgi:hypothetical protein
VRELGCQAPHLFVHYAAYRIAKSNFAASKKTWATFGPYAAVVAVLGAIKVLLFVLPMAMRM